MALVLKPSGGINILLREQKLPAYYPAATTPAARVRVFWHYDDEAPGAAREVPGMYSPGSEIRIPYNPDVDKNIVVRTISYSASGVPDVRSLEDAISATLIHQRVTEAPIIGQYFDAQPDSVTIAIADTPTLARKRRLKVSESLSGGGALVDPGITVFDSAGGELGRQLTISRTGNLNPVFAWSGNDPVGHGFTKTGSAPTEANGSGWRLNSLGTDASTFYTKSSWPAGAFAAGFSLDLVAPVVATTDNANPAQCAAIRVEDGTHRYELTFDADEVQLNGGASHAIGGSPVRLVIAAGGATADLWIGDTLTEDNTAAAATATSGLLFGDLATTDDADVTWNRISYQLSPVPVKLAQTIFASVAHSSGGPYGAESNIVTLTFSSETNPTSGSVATLDPTPNPKVDLSEALLP
jgi:hypothetical protein